MFNPIFWKKVQGQKHPERWEIAERQIRSVNTLFKTNTIGHKHPSIRLFIIEQDTISKTKENKKWHVTQEPCTPIKNQSYRLWWGADSPILNETPTVCIYTSYNRTRIKNAYIYILYIYTYILTQSWTGTKLMRKHIIQPTGFDACSSTCCQ